MLNVLKCNYINGNIKFIDNTFGFLSRYIFKFYPLVTVNVFHKIKEKPISNRTVSSNTVVSPKLLLGTNLDGPKFIFAFCHTKKEEERNKKSYTILYSTGDEYETPTSLL